MQNNCFCLCFSFLIFVGCSSNRVSIGMTSFKRALNNLESVDWNFTTEKVKNEMGEPSEQAFDEKTKTRVFRYLDANEKNARFRSYFIFENHPEVLTKKYINIFENDPESNLSYWNKKGPIIPSLEVRVMTVCQGHSIEAFQYAEITKFQRIEIEKGKVVRVFWQKDPFTDEKSIGCK